MDREQALTRLRLMEESQTEMWNIEAAEGEYLRELVIALPAQQVLEIGTSNGYSSIWLAMGVAETGGLLLTLEADAERYQLAQQNFEHATVTPYIDSRLGDALTILPTLSAPIDLAFIDAWKADYPIYLDECVAKMRVGGVIVAHNLESHREELQGFRDKLLEDPRLETQFVNLGPGGFSVSRLMPNG